MIKWKVPLFDSYKNFYNKQSTDLTTVYEIYSKKIECTKIIKYMWKYEHNYEYCVFHITSYSTLDKYVFSGYIFIYIIELMVRSMSFVMNDWVRKDCVWGWID